MLERTDAPATLLIAPTGGGETMAEFFLPTLTDLAQNPHEGLHTLYISLIKALAADIKRNFRTPVERMDLPVRIEDRTGETTATRMFTGVKHMIIDEIHALAESKRGDQLMLAMARLQTLCPDLWLENEDRLAIGIHYSSLDLGIDWGDADLVIEIGAPITTIMHRPKRCWCRRQSV